MLCYWCTSRYYSDSLSEMRTLKIKPKVYMSKMMNAGKIAEG